jgi:hypothetical protein
MARLSWLQLGGLALLGSALAALVMPAQCQGLRAHAFLAAQELAKNPQTAWSRPLTSNGWAPFSPSDKADPRFGVLAILDDQEQPRVERIRDAAELALQSPYAEVSGSIVLRRAVEWDISESSGKGAYDSLLQLARLMGLADPDNAFWPSMVGDFLTRSGDPRADDWFALASSKERWDDYAFGQVDLLGNHQKSKGYSLSRLQRSLAYAGTGFPHFRGLNGRTLSSPEAGRLGLLMVRDSEVLTGKLVGWQLAKGAQSSDAKVQAAVDRLEFELTSDRLVEELSDGGLRSDPGGDASSAPFLTAAALAASITGAALALFGQRLAWLNGPSWAKSALPAIVLAAACAASLRETWILALIGLGAVAAMMAAQKKPPRWLRIIAGGFGLAASLFILIDGVSPAVGGSVQWPRPLTWAGLIYALAASVWVTQGAWLKSAAAREGLRGILFGAGSILFGFLCSAWMEPIGPGPAWALAGLPLAAIGLAALIPGEKRQWQRSGWGLVIGPAALLAIALANQTQLEHELSFEREMERIRAWEAKSILPAIGDGLDPQNGPSPAGESGHSAN